MLKTFLWAVVAAVIGGVGHVLLRAGMRTVGDLTESAVGGRAPMVGSAASNPLVILGVVLQATFFFMYLALLSREELTVVLPLTSISYVVIALLAGWFLGEAVTAVRWAGIACVVLGVILVSRS